MAFVALGKDLQLKYSAMPRNPTKPFPFLFFSLEFAFGIERLEEIRRGRKRVTAGEGEKEREQLAATIKARGGGGK